jgi:hypothetical protein
VPSINPNWVTIPIGLALLLYIVFQSRPRSSPRTQHFAIKISGLIISDYTPESARTQLVVTLLNNGAVSTAHGWNLKLLLPGKVVIGEHLLGQQPSSNSISLPNLDETLRRNALGSNHEESGFVYFRVPDMSKDQLTEIIKTLDVGDIELTVLDEKNRESKVGQSIPELRRARFERTP